MSESAAAALVAAIDYWEQRFAAYYRSEELAASERAALHAARAAIEAGEGETARPLLTEWKTHHGFLGGTADTLAAGFVHDHLAELMQAVLAELDR